MPRPPRIEFPGAFYHVFSRGNRKEIIFHEESDFRMFESILFQYAEECQVSLYAWCLMPNHYHLVIRTAQANLSLFMHRLLTRYAHLYNLRYELVGHVFQGRFKAILCDEESYFLELIRYVHLNPVRAKQSLVPNLVDWKWSSHRYYVMNEAPALLRGAIQETMMRFGDSIINARENYLKFLGEKNTSDATDDLDTLRNGILGTEEFKERVRSKVAPDVESPDPLKGIRSAEELLSEVCGIFGRSLNELTAPDRNRLLCRMRTAFVYAGRRLYGLSAADLARSLKKDPSALSKMMYRMDNKGKDFPELRLLLDALRQDRQPPNVR